MDEEPRGLFVNPAGWPMKASQKGITGRPPIDKRMITGPMTRLPIQRKRQNTSLQYLNKCLKTSLLTQVLYLCCWLKQNKLFSFAEIIFILGILFCGSYVYIVIFSPLQ
jgi:hypothetical protein